MPTLQSMGVNAITNPTAGEGLCSYSLRWLNAEGKKAEPVRAGLLVLTLLTRSARNQARSYQGTALPHGDGPGGVRLGQRWPESTETIVGGEGPSNANIILVGQNPGGQEARQGRPFVGKSGKYLDQVLKKNNIQRSALYLTSLVKETTPGNRTPSVPEIRYWIPYLLEEISRVRPKIVVLMGKVARKTPRLDGIEYIETCHPAAAMRFPEARQRFESDFEKLAAKVAGLP